MALPQGWSIVDSSKSPFKSFLVITPDGYQAIAYSHSRSPENILYLLLEELFNQQQKDRTPEHHKTELAKRLQSQGYDLDELDKDNPYN